MASFAGKATIRVGLPCAAIVGLHYAYKRFNFNVQAYDVPGDLKKYVFIITGADKGIGKATVEALAPTGARVIMACRSADDCRDVRRQIVIQSRNRQVVCRECDLNSFESIKKFAARMIKEEPRIDVLINNAGVKYINPKKTTRESIERHLGVNFISHHLLTSLLLDKLKESAPSRIVNVIGNAYTKGKIDFDDLNSNTKYKPDVAYDQSKLAIALTTLEASRLLEGSQVTINGVDPGYTHTGIERYTDAWFKLIRSSFYFLFRRQPRQGAYPVLYAALSLEMKGVTGKYVSCDLEATEFKEEIVGDRTLQRKMFLTAEKWARVTQAKQDLQEIIASLPDVSKKAPDSVTKLQPSVASATSTKNESLTLST